MHRARKNRCQKISKNKARSSGADGHAPKQPDERIHFIATEDLPEIAFPAAHGTHDSSFSLRISSFLHPSLPPDPLTPRRRSPLWPSPVRQTRKQIPSSNYLNPNQEHSFERVAPAHPFICSDDGPSAPGPGIGGGTGGLAHEGSWISLGPKPKAPLLNERHGLLRSTKRLSGSVKMLPRYR